MKHTVEGAGTCAVLLGKKKSFFQGKKEGGAAAAKRREDWRGGAQTEATAGKKGWGTLLWGSTSG